MTRARAKPRQIRRGTQSVTAQDVAREVGVSPMTVSRVIAGSANVSEETRERVLAAASALNYAPNTAARTLASAAPARFGLLFSNPSSAWLSSLLVGTLDETGRRGAQLLIAPCEPGSPRSERAAVNRMVAGQVAGLLLPPPLCESPAVLKAIIAAGAPAVAIAMGVPRADISCVRVDDEKAAAEMTRRLLVLGHRHIGFITGNPNQSASARRLAGFERAMREFGVGARKSVAQGEFSYASGLAAANRLLDRKDRPTAIFASNDDMAAAAVSLAHRRGLDVPRDLSVAGFDDTAVATTLWPELTTIRQPIARMAAAAVELLLRGIQERRAGGRAAISDLVLEHLLVERGSTAPPRA
jgi:LacI family transcriptional regulator